MAKKEILEKDAVDPGPGKTPTEPYHLTLEEEVAPGVSFTPIVPTPFTAVLAVSGGMDSTTVLAHVLQERRPGAVLAVFFRYGSKHEHYEFDAFRRIIDHYKVPNWVILDLTNPFSYSGSNLLMTGGPIPEGHYQAETMKLTVVPGRNIVFCAFLASLAMARNIQDIFLGVHAGDHAIYPDCRPEFIQAVEKALQLGTDRPLKVHAPFLTKTKKDILEYGLGLPNPVPYHLTRTCYKAHPIACGKCGSCQERLEAWSLLSKQDPLLYQSTVISPKS